QAEERRRPGRHRPGGYDGVLEANLRAALHGEGGRVEELALAGDEVHLAMLGQADEVLRQRIDHLLPVATYRVDVDLGRAEGDPDVGGVASVGDQFRGVQDGLGGDAAHVQT